MSVSACRALAVLFMVVAGLVTAPARAGDALTPEQKQAVEQVVHDYLLKNPELMIEVMRAAEAKITQQKADDARQAIAAKRDELLADTTSPVGGNPKGDVTIVEFFDYSCPYCKQVEPLIESLVKEDPKIRIVYKEFPVLGPGSVFASHMALAALKQQRYAAFHDAMMATKGQITEDVVLRVAAASGVNVEKAKQVVNAPDIDAVIKRNFALAEALEINGTPAFVIGDVLVPGATNMDMLKKLVEDARKAG
jgi:protein-disulfide isomerase